jgi:moderate conductance mechanosensitive channel
MELHSYLLSFIDWLITTGIKSGLRIIFILILTFVALKFARMLSKKVAMLFKTDGDIEFKKRVDTISSVIRYIMIFGIVASSSMMILRELNIEIAPILAAAGVLGVAVGFGAQNLIQDLISGFLLLMEDQIRVGDVVEIGGKSGLVEKITLRMTVLRDLSGNVHYIRNSQINVVTNMTKDYSFYVFDIGISYKENIDRVIKIISEVDEELRTDPVFSGDILAPIEILGLDRFADSAVMIKARTKTRPITQWTVGREFNKRLKIRFDDEKIEIPYPQRTLSMDNDLKNLLSDYYKKET